MFLIMFIKKYFTLTFCQIIETYMNIIKTLLMFKIDVYLLK